MTKQDYEFSDRYHQRTDNGYIAQKRQAQESVLPLVNEKGELAMTDMEKAEVLNEIFALVFVATRILIFLMSLKLASLTLWVGTGGNKSPSCCKSRISLRLPRETECIQVYGAG